MVVRKPTPKLKSILLIYTGGTIGMIRNEQDQTYEPFNFSLIESVLPELSRLACNIEVKSFDPPLDSSNMSPEIWSALARIIADHYQDFDGFVILHGSDTMAYTGSALSFMIEGLRKPVILTGSQLPINEIRTDARENLLTAIQIASLPDTPIKEVAIYFEYRLFRANRTKKMHAEVFNAFSSPNFPELAQAGVHLRIFRPTPDDAFKTIPFRIQEQMETKIGHQRFYPGLVYSLPQTFFFSPDVKGIILESFGAGNLPTDEALFDLIREGTKQGKIILNITQCPGGSVEMGRYATSKKLAELGVLSGKDLTFEAALTKMMYLMGKYEDPEEVKHFLIRNIRGEMTAERAYTRPPNSI